MSVASTCQSLHGVKPEPTGGHYLHGGYPGQGRGEYSACAKRRAGGKSFSLIFHHPKRFLCTSKRGMRRSTTTRSDGKRFSSNLEYGVAFLALKIGGQDLNRGLCWNKKPSKATPTHSRCTSPALAAFPLSNISPRGLDQVISLTAFLVDPPLFEPLPDPHRLLGDL